MTDHSTHEDEETPYLPGLVDPLQAESWEIEVAAKYARVHPRTIQKWRAAKKIEPAGGGRISAASLLHYLEQRHVKQTPHAPARPVQPPEVSEPLRAPRRVREDFHHLVTLLEREQDDVRQLVRILEQEREDFRQLVQVLTQQLQASQERETELLSVLKARTGRVSQTPPRPQPPAAGTLRYRLLEYLQQAGGPTHVWRMAQAFQDTQEKSVYREVSRLVEQGFALRVKPGLYAAVNVPLVQEMPAVSPLAVPLLEQVREIVQQAGRPVQTAEIQQRLQTARPLRQALSKLVQRGILSRLRPGVFTASRIAGEPEATPTTSEQPC